MTIRTFETFCCKQAKFPRREGWNGEDLIYQTERFFLRTWQILDKITLLTTVSHGGLMPDGKAGVWVRVSNLYPDTWTEQNFLLLGIQNCQVTTLMVGYAFYIFPIIETMCYEVFLIHYFLILVFWVCYPDLNTRPHGWAWYLQLLTRNLEIEYYKIIWEELDNLLP